MAPTPKHIAIIQGHPDPRGHHFCHAIADAYAKGALEAGHHVERIDIATLDFPLVRCKEEFRNGPTPPEIQEAQATIARAQHLVLVYPLWQGTLPALLKGFLEQTFRPGFSFGAKQPTGFWAAVRSRHKPLQGKTARVVVTMAMSGFVARILRRWVPERQVLGVCGIGPIRETLIGLVEGPVNARRVRWLDRMCEMGRRGA